MLKTILKGFDPLLKMASLVFAAGFFSCTPAHDTTSGTPGDYFNLHTYFNSQAAILRNNEVKILKSVMRAGQREEHAFNAVDWEKELKIFVDADLNKASWKDLYMVDSVPGDSSLGIRYTAKDSALQVKQETIYFTGNDVTEIQIESRFKNFYYASALQLNYKPADGYHISGEQQIRFANKQSFEINALFLKNQ